mmetsp:Transcript_53844/g.125232  ORF Transcript_53844/g.125232 Transcript_53844/m.125232 type:complete len:273 (-) Transcript_53844:120-938(-)
MPRHTAPRAGAEPQDRTRQFSKTKLCKFELLGICAKGTHCPFAHTAGELRDLPDLRCTKLCFEILRTGHCSKWDCTFAHSREELRTTGSLHKTKLCRFAQMGNCTLGPKCSFAHSASEIRRPDSAAPQRPLAAPPVCKLVPETTEESLDTFSGTSRMDDPNWAAAWAYGLPTPWLLEPPYAAQGRLDEPAYVPLWPEARGSASSGSTSPNHMEEESLLQGSVIIDQTADAWQVKAAPDDTPYVLPIMRSVRTSESTLCTLGDEPATAARVHA